MEKKIDRRSHNNAHTAVKESGADAARRREPVHSCPYSHPAMRSSWLHGYAEAQQMTLTFDLESPDA